MSAAVADTTESPEWQAVEVRTGIVPSPLPGPYAAGRWDLDTVYNVPVGVRSANGTWGFGYAFDFDPGGARTLQTAISALGEVVRAFGALDTELLHTALTAKSNFSGASGVYMSAMGALDLAVWDLKGRLLGVPVHTLLGSTRTRIPAYASGGGFNLSLDELEREIKEYLDEGFTAVKIKLPPDVKSACERIAASRSWVGSEVRMMYDLNQQLRFKEAAAVAACASDHGAYWLEEPLPYWDLRGYSELRPRVNCRIALGETLYGARAFYEVVRLDAADVLMPNLHKIGGVTGWTTVRGIASATGVPISSHIMSEVAAQVMSATQDADLLEYMHLSEALYDNPFKPAGGELVIAPDGPGFGLEASKAVRDALEL